MPETARRKTSRRRKQRSGQEKVHQKLDWVFVGFLAISPLVLGGTHPLTASILAGVAIVLALADVGLRVAGGDRVRAPALLWIFLGLIVFALLRNASVFAFLSPGLVREGYTLWPEIAARGTASPGRTVLWAWKMLGAASALFYAANRFRRSDRAWKLALGVVIAGVLTAILGITQDLLKAQGHLFFYNPIDWDRVSAIAGPFVNPNQAGSLAALAAIVSFGAAHQQQKLKFRVTFIAAGLFLAGYTFIAGAQAAMIALGVATLMLLVAAALTRDRETNTELRRLIAAAVAVTAMVGALLMLFVIIPVELVPGASKAGDKLVLWRESAAAINHAPIFGFGSASFQDIFPYIDTIQRHEFARNVESALLQVLIEQGVIPSMVLFGAIALLFIRTTRDHRFARRYMFPSFIGITVFLVLDVSWGMSLQAESYAIIAAALVGAVAGRPKKAGRAIRQRQSGWAAAGTIALTGIICAFGISSAIETSLADSELPFAEVQQREDIPPALEEAGKSRPLNLVVLAQSTGLHAAVEQFERADAIVLFLVDEAPQRQIVWRAAFKISAQDGSSLDKCDLVNRYWKEFGELPAEIANVVRSEPAFAECIVAREESEQCSVIAELLPMLNSDERFLLVNRMMEVERSECVLGASVELSIGSPFSPLAENWVAELEDMGDLQAETHLTLARHYESRGAHDKELQHLLAAREILDDNAQVGLEVLEALIGLVRSEQAPNGWYQRFTAYSEAVRLDTFQDSELAMKLRRLDAEAAYLADDVERAKEEFDSLRNAGSEAKRAETHLYLARIAREQGRYRDAINAYRMTLRFEPQNEEAKQALEELNATVR